jgi:transcriptional regulator with XRE-family HTH domain
MSRMKDIRTALNLSQKAMAQRLAVSQPSICRIESGLQIETGPISLLLDAIERELAAGLPAANPADGPAAPSAGTGAAAPALSRDAAAPFSHEVHDV